MKVIGGLVGFVVGSVILRILAKVDDWSLAFASEDLWDPENDGF